MGRPKKGTTGDYFAEWDSDKRTFRLIAKGRVTKTPIFALGNATIRLDPNNLPEKILKQITGESKNTRFLPVDTTYLNRWETAVASVEVIRRSVRGFKGTTATLKYPEARSFSLYHYENVVDIKPNGRTTATTSGGVTNFGETSDPMSGVQGSLIPMDKNGTYYDDMGVVATVKNGVVDVYGRDLYGVFYKWGSIGTVDGAVPVEAIAGYYYGANLGAKVRFNDGTVRKYYMAQGPVQTGETLHGVARITKHGEYYATSRCYKTGPGNTGVAQFLSNRKDQNFIISVFEGQYADALIVAEEGRIRVVFPSGSSKTFAGDTPIAKVFFSSAGDFVVTGTDGDYVMHQVTEDGGGLEIPCEDCGFISLHQRDVGKVVLGGYSDAPPVGGALRTYDKWRFVRSEWVGVGQTGHVVEEEGDSGWWHLEPEEVGGYIQFMEAPYYVADGKTHVLLCRSQNYPFYGPGELTGEEAVITAAEGHAALDTVYRASPKNKVNLSAIDAKYFISGEANGIFFNYAENPRVRYTPETVDNLYWSR